jgi:hypothetical protein
MRQISPKLSGADFSVVLFRPHCMLVSEEHPALHQKSGQYADPPVNKAFSVSL